MAENPGSRIANVILRFLQLCSAAIVVGTIGWAMHRINDVNDPGNGGFVYAEVVGSMNIVVSLVLFPPLESMFRTRSADLVLLVSTLS